MKLELCLALHCHHPSYSSEGLDLNGSVDDWSQLYVDGVGRRGLTRVSSASSECSVTSGSHNSRRNKRGCGEAFGSPDDGGRTLPLLVWDKQPNEEDDPPNEGISWRNCSLAIYNKGGEEGVVGWPPVKEWRKNVRRRNRCCLPTVENGCGACGRALAESKYVKVKMEGVGIARKIDVSLFNSLEMLKAKSVSMFERENLGSYRMIYKDREGDWFLAQDIPWRTFLGSVQQLKLQRIN